MSEDVPSPDGHRAAPPRDVGAAPVVDGRADVNGPEGHPRVARKPRRFGFFLGAALGALLSGWRVPSCANCEMPTPSAASITMATTTTPMELARTASAPTPASAVVPVCMSQLSAERILLDEALGGRATAAKVGHGP